MNNSNTNQESIQQNDNAFAWEKPVLYKEDWMNTMKSTPGAEDPFNSDGLS
jgi:hypothetical protein